MLKKIRSLNNLRPSNKIAASTQRELMVLPNKIMRRSKKVTRSENRSSLMRSIKLEKMIKINSNRCTNNSNLELRDRINMDNMVVIISKMETILFKVREKHLIDLNEMCVFVL